MTATAPTLPPGLTFSKKDHTYRYNRIVVPSVTQVLHAEGFLRRYDAWDPEVRAWAMERGSRADEACSLLDQALELDESSIDPIIRPYVHAYRCFLDDSDFLPRYSQQPVIIGSGRCAGTLDVAGSLPGRANVIIDRKLGEIHPATALQTAAYALGLGDGRTRTILDPCWWERFGLRLMPTGNPPYRLVPFEQPHDDLMFLAVLSSYEWKRRYLPREEWGEAEADEQARTAALNQLATSATVTCDWGEGDIGVCDGFAVAIRNDREGHGWLPVCNRHTAAAEALARLASMEGFRYSFALSNDIADQELLARIEYARKAYAALGTDAKTR